MNIDDDKDKSDDEMEMIIKRRFLFTDVGHSFRITELEGALGLAELENYKEMLATRLKNAKKLINSLKVFEEYIQLPSIRPSCGHAFMMFPIVMRDSKKEQLVNYLEQNGIETRDMLPLVNQPIYKKLFNIKDVDFPVSKWINDSGFYIGCHQGIGQLELEHIFEAFRSFFLKKGTIKDEKCLIVIPNFINHPDVLNIELFISSISLGQFNESYILLQKRDEEIERIFLKYNFKIISNEKNKYGKGELLSSVMSKVKSENVVVIGLDGSDNPYDINKILLKLEQGWELVVTTRFHPKGMRNKSKFLSYRSLGNRFFAFLLNIILNKNATDPNHSFRGFKKSCYHKLNLKSKGFTVMYEMTLMALEKNIKYDEFPTIERPPFIQIKKTNNFLNAFSILWLLFKYVVNPKNIAKKKRVIYEG